MGKYQLKVYLYNLTRQKPDDDDVFKKTRKTNTKEYIRLWTIYVVNERNYHFSVDDKIML